MYIIEDGILQQNKRLIEENEELVARLEPFERGESYWFEECKKVKADNDHLLELLRGNRQ